LLSGKGSNWRATTVEGGRKLSRHRLQGSAARTCQERHGRWLPQQVPKADPQRILSIGDTGCRIKGKKAQTCSDAVKWPFPLMAEVAA
jgi:hypothetical protein